MNKKWIFLLALTGCMLTNLQAQKKSNKPVAKAIVKEVRNPYFSQDAAMDKFIADLLSKMTIEEKIGQLNLPSAGDFVTGQVKSSDIGKKIEKGEVGGLFNIKGVKKIREIQKMAVENSRLKIPMIFGMDVIHGYETNFPIPLGLASSWDMQLIEQSARVAAQEATADGICWTFSPMVDLARDPRWGRVAEGSGEDPYLGGQIAAAMVRGYQGNGLGNKNTMAACVKHFALYGAPEGGRDYNTVDMSRVRMYNEYFPPYKAAFDAGAATAMASFNEIDGIPATGNRWLLTSVLRDQWKFRGFVVTDYTGINEMIEHGMGDLQQVSSLALKAGVDMDMVGEGFLTTLKKSLAEGKVTQAQITEATRRILEIKYRLGLFKDPYLYCDESRAVNEVYNTEHRQIARNTAAQSMVLLKNDQNTLPLKAGQQVAVIGPLAQNPENMPGTWSVAAKHANSVYLLQGLKETLGNQFTFTFARGSNFEEDIDLENRYAAFGKNSYRDSRTEAELVNEAVETAAKADIVLLAVGEMAEMSGESSSRTRIDIPAVQRRLIKAIKNTGKPVVLVLFTGRPLVLTDEAQLADAILNVWFPGSEAGYAIADVLSGKINPSGKLPMSFPRNVGQVPVYYNHKNTGRPEPKEGSHMKFRSVYLDEVNSPLYPFGYGLSYTTFAYGDLKLNSEKLSGNSKLNVSVDLTNTGKYDGAEIVQLYIRDKVGTITRPVKELKDFQKVFLKAGESKTVTFEVTTDDLKFYNSDLHYDWESGDFTIGIGSNSRDVQTKDIIWNK